MDLNVKEEAVIRMQIAKINEMAINAFKDREMICCSDDGLVRSLLPKEQEIVQDFEDENGGTVYHMIRSDTSIGLMFSLMYVSCYPEEWRDNQDVLRAGKPCVYVYNDTYPIGSEIGHISIISVGGAVYRTE